jgi:hypothetical protein
MRPLGFFTIIQYCDYINELEMVLIPSKKYQCYSKFQSQNKVPINVPNIPIFGMLQYNVN